MADFSGIIFVVLDGQENYHRWARSFKNAATAVGVWEFFTGNIRVINADLTEKDNSDGVGAFQKDKIDFFPIGNYEVHKSLQGSMRTYIEPEGRPKLISKAMILLRQSLTPDIADILPSYDDPKKAWDFLESQYSFGTKSSQAWKEMQRLSSRQYNDFSHYINAVVRIQHDINDAGQDCGDPLVKNKILTDLLSDIELTHEVTDVTNRASDMSMKQFTFEILQLQRNST